MNNNNSMCFRHICSAQNPSAFPCLNSSPIPCVCSACTAQRAFRFLKADRITGAGLPGAVFQLTAPNGAIMTGVSNTTGWVQFFVAPCTNYILTELVPPLGYAPMTVSHQIMVDSCARLYVDGQWTDFLQLPNDRILPPGAFTAMKVSSLTGLPLQGAQFSLNMGGQVIATATSQADGSVTFSNLAAGTYELLETAPPPGYQPSGPLPVVVHADGSVTINDLPANGFPIQNIPGNGFSFHKYTMAGIGLAGAAFELSSGGTVIGMAVSDLSGLVNFGTLPAGTYQMTETQPPAGYLPNTHIYQVQVMPGGAITVDGAPLGTFSITNIPLLFSVTYDANGGIGAHMDVNLPGSSTYIIKTAAEADIFRTSYVLASWNTEPDGTGVALLPGQSITILSNLSLYAQWVPA